MHVSGHIHACMYLGICWGWGSGLWERGHVCVSVSVYMSVSLCGWVGAGSETCHPPSHPVTSFQRGKPLTALSLSFCSPPFL